MKRCDSQTLDPSAPPQRFSTGQALACTGQEEPKAGTVLTAIWHLAEKRWYYFLERDGTMIDGRYAEEDLRPLDS